MSTTNFTLAAIGWLTLPSRAPTPLPPPGPPPPTDEGGPSAGTHRAAPSLVRLLDGAPAGRADKSAGAATATVVGSNLGLVPANVRRPPGRSRPSRPVA